MKERFPVAIMKDRPDPDVPQLPEDLVKAPELRAFLMHVVRETGVTDFRSLAVIWSAICQAALSWLIREKKSIDLGFCVIHPTPFRANWKQILVAQFPKLGGKLAGKGREAKATYLEDSGFTNALGDASLPAISEDDSIMYGVEVETRRVWNKAVLRHESDKLRKLGSSGYQTYTARQILVRLKNKMIGAYISFLNKISLPCGAVRRSRVDRSPLLVKYVPKGKIRPVGARDVETYTVVPNKSLEQGEPVIVEDEDAPLHSLSSLQSAIEDVRE